MQSRLGRAATLGQGQIGHGQCLGSTLDPALKSSPEKVIWVHCSGNRELIGAKAGKSDVQERGSDVLAASAIRSKRWHLGCETVASGGTYQSIHSCMR